MADFSKKFPHKVKSAQNEALTNYEVSLYYKNYSVENFKRCLESIFYSLNETWQEFWPRKWFCTKKQLGKRQAVEIFYTTTARAIVLTSICLRKYTSGHITKAGEEIDWLIWNWLKDLKLRSRTTNFEAAKLMILILSFL